MLSSIVSMMSMLRRRRLTMLNPSLQAGVAAPHEAVPCKGTTAENDHRYDRYQSVTDYRVKKTNRRRDLPRQRQDMTP